MIFSAMLKTYGPYKICHTFSPKKYLEKKNGVMAVKALSCLIIGQSRQ